MTPEEHKARHQMLHKHFDELVADWISHTNNLPTKSTVYDLMEWAYQQTLKPTEHETARS